MGKVYANSEEKFVMNTVIYGDSTTNKAYWKLENGVYKDAIACEDLLNVFIKGCTVKVGDYFTKPLGAGLAPSQDNKASVIVALDSDGEQLMFTSAEYTTE